jgi:hypothetical protein
MSGLTLHPAAARTEPYDLQAEIERTEVLLEERRVELSTLQLEFRDFRTLYTRVVGGPLAELAELESAIREAEKRVLGIESFDDACGPEAQQLPSKPAKTSLRKLFWSVARMFHPDHATDENEARRRHAVMTEANRAYREGDFDSLQTLLGDEELQLFCTSSHVKEEESLSERLWSLKDELRTIEFGIRRIKQDALYRVKISADEQATLGKDVLRDTAESIRRKILKARRRLEHFS